MVVRGELKMNNSIEVVKRTYPEAVININGERIPAGVKLELPVSTARQFEKRFGLKEAPISQKKLDKK